MKRVKTTPHKRTLLGLVITLARQLETAGEDDLVVFSAGMAIGAEGQPGIGVMELAALSDAVRFRLVETRSIGGDVMNRWRAS